MQIFRSAPEGSSAIFPHAEVKFLTAPEHVSRRRVPYFVFYLVYLLALATAVSIWFIPLRVGLSLDETGSYWNISKGFSQIWPRGFISLGFPLYSYILWLSAKILGTSEVGLRIPSVLAMFGAAYLLYRAAREMFERDAAIFTTIVFCIYSIVIYAAIDARPYAFGVLAINAATLVLLRLRNNDSMWMAALFGILAATVVYFHYLFAAILPAFAICFFLIKTGDRKTMWLQFSIASAVIFLLFLPLIPGLEYSFHTSGSHVYEEPPRVIDAIRTLVPWWPRPVFLALAAVILLYAAFIGRREPQGSLLSGTSVRQALFCATLALVPLLVLFGISRETSMHMFADRHRLIVVPGAALGWGFVISRFPQPVLRVLYCVAAVAATSYYVLRLPDTKKHFNSWREAVAVIENNAHGAPIMMVSRFVESDFMTMPVDSPKESPLFAPLSYYKIREPIIPMPKHFSATTVRVASPFLEKALGKHERFLAAENGPPYPTLQWIVRTASASDNVHDLGVHDGIRVLEFVPKERTISQK